MLKILLFMLFFLRLILSLKFYMYGKVLEVFVLYKDFDIRVSYEFNIGIVV